MKISRKFYRWAGLTVVVIAGCALVLNAYDGKLLGVIGAMVAVIGGSFFYLTKTGDGDDNGK